MDSEFWSQVSYVEMSGNRREALGILVDAGRPLTPVELAERMGVVLKTASRTVRQLADQGLVKCVNPDEPRDRRYTPTERGRRVLAEVAQKPVFEHDAETVLAESPAVYELEVPEELGSDASYVRRSENRMKILERLEASDRPLTPSELEEDLDIGFDSVSRALRQMSERELVKCVNPEAPRYRRYELTGKGERVLQIFQE